MASARAPCWMALPTSMAAPGRPAPTYINGLETFATGLQIVVVGPRNNPRTQELIRTVWGKALPNRLLYVVEIGRGAAHRPSRLRQGHAERRAHRLSLPAQYLLGADHQRGDAEPGAHPAPANPLRPVPWPATLECGARLTYEKSAVGRAMSGQTVTIKGKDGDFSGYLASPGSGPRSRPGGHPRDFRRQPGDARHRRRHGVARLFRPGARSVLAARAQHPAHRQDRRRLEKGART